MEIKRENVEKYASTYSISEMHELIDNNFDYINIVDENNLFTEEQEDINWYLQTIFELRAAINLKLDINDIKFKWFKRSIYSVLYPINEFITLCKYGYFDKVLGNAYYSTSDLVSDLIVDIETAKANCLRDDFKYILWIGDVIYNTKHI